MNTNSEFWPYEVAPFPVSEDAEALRVAEESGQVTVPEIVRDVQAAGHCAECGESLAKFKTITMHEGKPYCPCCFNPGAGS